MTKWLGVHIPQIEGGITDGGQAKINTKRPQLLGVEVVLTDRGKDSGGDDFSIESMKIHQLLGLPCHILPDSMSGRVTEVLRKNTEK